MLKNSTIYSLAFHTTCEDSSAHSMVSPLRKFKEYINLFYHQELKIHTLQVFVFQRNNVKITRVGYTGSPSWDERCVVQRGLSGGTTAILPLGPPCDPNERAIKEIMIRLYSSGFKKYPRSGF